jgi:SSS family transporter
MTHVRLHAWDWVFLVWFLAVSLGVGVYYTRRAGSNLAEYFLSGRDLPWWALGTSMVATTFASDTPLVVSGLVISKGIAGNWLWWNFLFGGTLTVFVFSRLWRRSRTVTEIELIARRYDGASASALRGFKALYLGILVNSLVFGWVTKAMAQVLTVITGLDPPWATAILIVITVIYTILSGLWGVVATDVLQFAMAMAGAIILAALSVGEVGGLGPLVERVSALGREQGRDFLAMFPTGWNAFTAAVLVLVFVNWWAVYYPGAEPAGGGYVAQRMLAAKDEKHARAGTLWFTFAHYCIRPWPWILVGLAAITLEPRFLDSATHGPDFAAEKAYPWMFRVLPVGMLGLVVASFFAAFMSTLCSLLNLSASYVVNDFYMPFLAGARLGERGQVLAARLSVAIVALAGCLVSWYLISVASGWMLVMEITAGTGLVLVLRWLWWRVNAWSEIAAMIASAVVCLLTKTARGESLLMEAAGGNADLAGTIGLLVIVGVTTLVWLVVTFGTPPVSSERLAEFFRQVRPPGWWGPVARATGLSPGPVARDIGLWISSTAMIFGSLFGVGAALLLDAKSAVVFLAIAAVGGFCTYIGLTRETR